MDEKIIIAKEVNKIVQFLKDYKNTKISDDYAFNYLIIKYLFFNGSALEDCFLDITDIITDGPNDGGIDFVYYDEENNKIILGQSKYTETITPNELISELNKMSNTFKNFSISNTGSYNSKLKKQLQNAIDRLSDEDTGNVEYYMVTKSNLDIVDLYNKIDNQHGDYSNDMVSIYQLSDIHKLINDSMIAFNIVEYESVKIDRPKNCLKYETENTKGVIVNLSSKSLITLFNKYADKGLFDLNIRKFIGNKMVDDGIKRTLEKDRDSFWFLNNGLIIACKEYDIDGNTVKLEDFSIVNGGQTTNIIGKYKGNNSQEFFIPCKIVSNKKTKNSAEFFNKIAEATNSQKPILPRDLKSNSPEMRALKKWLHDEGIELEIKRGEKSSLNKPKYKIKNDELGQFILSFVLQKPGTSRSGKKRLFDSNDIYNQVFRVNYRDDIRKREFITSAIDLISRTTIIINDLKKSENKLNEMHKEILKNGTQIIYALLGIIYRVANNDLTEEDLINNPSIIKTINAFEYRNILNQNYDELDDNLEKIIIRIVMLVTDQYSSDSGNQSLSITSVSNYFKTDKKYHDLIIPGFATRFQFMAGQEILKLMYIFKY